MKLKVGIFTGLICLSLSAVAEQKSLDPMVVGKGLYTLKAEDNDLRIMEITFQPGQKMDLHEHPKHVVYAVTPGTLKIYSEGKEPKDNVLKAGDVVVMPAEKHWGQNTGATPVKLLVVELKGKK